MFGKILVANRGEIALRVIRACRELGIASAAVYSEADSESLHLRWADEKLCIGPPPSNKSYLDQERILGAAQQCGADAIHPGYGYLAENGDFAEKCEQAGIAFIGPTPDCLRLTGDKLAAKQAMQSAAVPVVPSSPGAVQTVDEADAFARTVGYPVMIKASAGGGGRGIRVCPDAATLREELAIARAEARAAFGNDEIYIEKYLSGPRHVEFQVVADCSGNIAHLGERECTVQRRFQKLIEESPSPALSPELRHQMGEAAIRAMRAVGYRNAGTVEFLLDQDRNFYFIEINSRIQVEHPVTELVTGIDLVKEQIRLACGEPLGYASADIVFRGAAIECRINAEDPDRRFLPCPGRVDRYHPPSGPGVRFDTHLYQGYELPVFYDSLLGKLIAHAADRPAAIAVMRRALGELVIFPVKTTIPLHVKVMEDPAFQAGELDTGYIKKFVPDDDDDDDEDF
jgi:acetyl-CoA carboxylase biotin carboxylase subunit